MTRRETFTLDEVYGLSRDVPKTYVSRNAADSRFVADLKRSKHIVVHGSSKQGKTCLRKTHLKPEDSITIQCTRDTTKAKLYELILKLAGVGVQVTETESQRTSVTSGAEGSVAGGVPWLAKAKAVVTIKRSRGGESKVTRERFEIDLTDPNDITRVLNEAKFDKYIVIEDFHYLDEEVQRSLAFDLKVFHEVSPYVFIIVGVWLEANKLILFNGDLVGRVSTIDVDLWTREDLWQVITKGERLLNITFFGQAKSAILTQSQNNVGLLQEVCYGLCEKHGVLQTETEPREIGTREDVEDQYRRIAQSQAARYLNFLHRFSEGLHQETELRMYKWLVWVVIKAEAREVRQGLRKNAVFQRIAEVHPQGDRLRQNNVDQALERVTKVQARHKLQPPILDYSDSRLRVVDAGFIVFLQFHPETELLQAIGGV